MIFTETEIAEKLKGVIEALKAVKSGWKPAKNKEKKYPEYNQIYAHTIELVEKVETHAVYGVVPKELLKKRSPNQSAEEEDYMISNYKQVTLPVFTDYKSTINRMWNAGNWDIKFMGEKGVNKGEDSLQEYINKGIYIHGSLEVFFKDILANKKAIDGNAVLVIKPKTLPLVENELCDPIPIIYDSENVILFSEGEYCMVETFEKSVVEYQNTKKKEGLVYEFYDQKSIWKIYQVGKAVEYQFKIELIVPEHNCGKLPCQKLKGIPRLCKDEIIYQTPFLAAVDILDDVALDSTYLRASKAKSAFPYQYMIGDKCEFDNGKGPCNGGYVLNEEGGSIKCPECKGSGTKSRISPLGVMIIKPPDKYAPGDSGINGPPMGYVAPDRAILDFLTSSVFDGLHYAASVLKTKKSNSTISVSGGNKTATEDINDNKDMYALVQSVSDQTFELFEFATEMIGRMRYKGDYVPPQITYPKTFDFRTEEDYTKEIANAIANKMPDIAIYQLIYAYINTRFSSQKETIDTFLLILQADRLALSAPDDIALMAAGNTVSKWEQILHTSAMSFISELVNNDPKFFEKEMKDKVKALQDLAKKKESELTPVAATL